MINYFLLTTIIIYLLGSYFAVRRVEKVINNLDKLWDNMKKDMTGECPKSLIKRRVLWYIIAVVFSWLAYAAVIKIENVEHKVTTIKVDEEKENEKSK